MTTKLIQELVGLCVEKESQGLCVLFKANHESTYIKLDDDDAPAQLQAAIDKIKEL